MSNWIISAGIDIGTSTSHLTISRLKVEDVSISNRVPNSSITKREIIYRSSISFTPLNQDGSIDPDGVAAIVKRAYDEAGFKASEIFSGAVIITGESAKLRNAKELSLAIAEESGSFVVAAAGPQLEGLLAGRGSGAEKESREKSKTICNIDIGGGTCNYAVFTNGEYIDGACLGIGGRCIQFDSRNSLSKFSESGETFLDGVAKLNQFTLGTKADKDFLELIAALLSEIILHAACSSTPPQIVQRLMQTDPLRHDYEIDEYWISGGIAECMRDTPQDPFIYGDLGVFLANALPGALRERKLNYQVAEPGIRATVIGAALHTLQLSGSTVTVSNKALPLRNVRILRPFQTNDQNLSAVELEHKIKNSLLDAESSDAVAISICDVSKLSYDKLKDWAIVLAAAHKKRKSKTPLIVLSQKDIGMALGQTIQKQCPDIDLIILDGVDSSFGDFIDIGVPLPGDMSTPLTVKTLIFN